MISRLQNLSHYPALADAGRRMPDDGRLHSKPENLARHTLCAKNITRLLPSMMALTIPQNTSQKRCRNNDSLSGYGGLRQAAGAERLAKCRVFGINRADGEKRVIHSVIRDEPKKSPPATGGELPEGVRQCCLRTKSVFSRTAQSGQGQSSGICNQRVPAGNPSFSSPWRSS